MTRETIGCSELGALFGVDQRCTRRHLYLRLIGAAPDRVTTAPMIAGQVYESLISSWYCGRHHGYQWDAKYARREDPPMVCGRLHGHPDGLITVVGDREPSINGEIKIPLHSRHEWRNGPPLHYQWQAQGQMALTGFAACVVVECMDLEVRGDEVVHIHCREHLVERDESVHTAILEECERFFAEHVIPRVPPLATADDLDDLKAQPPHEGAETELTGDAALLADEWRFLGVNRSEAQKRVAEIEKIMREREAKLLETIGQASRARLPNGAVIERKARHRREFTVAASTSYTLTYKDPK